MSDLKISQMSLSDPLAADEIPARRGSANPKLTPAGLAEFTAVGMGIYSV